MNGGKAAAIAAMSTMLAMPVGCAGTDPGPARPVTCDRRRDGRPAAVGASDVGCGPDPGHDRDPGRSRSFGPVCRGRRGLRRDRGPAPRSARRRRSGRSSRPSTRRRREPRRGCRSRSGPIWRTWVRPARRTCGVSTTSRPGAPGRSTPGTSRPRSTRPRRRRRPTTCGATSRPAARARDHLAARVATRGRRRSPAVRTGTVDISIRGLVEADGDDFLRVDGTAFSFHPTAEMRREGLATTEWDRMLGAFDARGEMCGVAGAYSQQLTLPGGASVPVAGVTAVGVLPTHRRRGVLTALMARPARRRGGAAARRWRCSTRPRPPSTAASATAWPAATPRCASTAGRSAFAVPVDPAWSLRLIDDDEAVEVAPAVYRGPRGGAGGRHEPTRRLLAGHLRRVETWMGGGEHFTVLCDSPAGDAGRATPSTRCARERARRVTDHDRVRAGGGRPRGRGGAVALPARHRPHRRRRDRRGAGRRPAALAPGRLAGLPGDRREPTSCGCASSTRWRRSPPVATARPTRSSSR